MYTREGYRFFDGTEKGESLDLLIKQSIQAYGTIDESLADQGSPPIHQMMESMPDKVIDEVIHMYTTTANSYAYSCLLKKYVPYWLRLLDVHGYDACIAGGPSCFFLKDINTAETLSEKIGKSFMKVKRIKDDGSGTTSLLIADRYFNSNQIYLFVKNMSKRGVMFYQDSGLAKSPSLAINALTQEYLTFKIGLYDYPSPIYTIGNMIENLTS